MAFGLRVDGGVNVAYNPDVSRSESATNLDEINSWENIISIDASGHNLAALDALGNIKLAVFEEIMIHEERDGRRQLSKFEAPRFPSGTPTDIRLACGGRILFAKTIDDTWYYLSATARYPHWILFAESTPVLKKMGPDSRFYQRRLCNIATLNASGNLTRWQISIDSNKEPRLEKWTIDTPDVIDVVPLFFWDDYGFVKYREYANSEYSDISDEDYDFKSFLLSECGIRADGTLRPILTVTLFDYEEDYIKLHAFENESDVLGRSQQLTMLRKHLSMRKEREHHQQEWKAKGLCQYCGGTFEGRLFRKKCSRCGFKKGFWV